METVSLCVMHGVLVEIFMYNTVALSLCNTISMFWRKIFDFENFRKILGEARVIVTNRGEFRAQRVKMLLLFLSELDDILTRSSSI